MGRKSGIAKGWMERRARAMKAKEKTAVTEDARALDSCGKACSIEFGEAIGSDEEEAFCEEGVKKKMGVLARMVGMEGCGQPGVVLTEVVRVLKELDGRARGVCSSRK